MGEDAALSARPREVRLVAMKAWVLDRAGRSPEAVTMLVMGPSTALAMTSALLLRLIVLAATGTNNVDLDTARSRGIAVCNLRDYCTASVVQHTLGVLLLLTQKLREYDALVRRGAWQKGDQFCLLDYPIRELVGRKLGIVGYGALGKGVARAAHQALGMDVLIAQRPGGERTAGRVDLDELLPLVDVLSLHCPLTPAPRAFRPLSSMPTRRA